MTRRSTILGVAALVAALWAMPAPLPAADFLQVIPLRPAALGASGRFGSALVVGDRVVAVGAYLSATDSGAVYLFHRDDLGNWSEVQPPLQGRPGDWFGFDVAIDGNQLLVGAPRARDASAARTGAAYRFDLGRLAGGGPATLVGTLPIAGGREGDEIGSAVAVSGGRWAVGARSDGHAGAGAGCVYVGSYDGVKDLMEQRLVPDAPADGAQFGQAASLDGGLGGILAVGAPLLQVGGAPTGAAFVYDLGTNGWPRTRLSAPVGPGDAFGYAVAASAAADLIVVGAPLRDGSGKGAQSGAAYLYGRQPQPGGTWPQPRQLDAGSEAGAQFGVAVTVDRTGKTPEIVVGARHAHGDTGAAYPFDAAGNALPALPVPAPSGAEFGFEVAMNGGILVVGAFLQNDGAGAAYLFEPVAPHVQVVTVQFAAASQTVLESAGTIRLPLLVSTDDGQPTAAAAAVQVAATDGTATQGTDFRLVAQRVEIPAGTKPGQGSAAVDVVILRSPLFERDEAFTVVLSSPTRATLGTQATEVITLHDDDPAGLTITLAHPPPLRTDDDGAADLFTVSLISQPSADVVVGFAAAPGQGVLSPAALVFTPADWNQSQTVTISGVEDPACVGQTAISYAIAVTTASADPRYAALSPPAAPTYTVRVVNRHRDRTSIVPSLAVVAPGDGTASYTLVLRNDGECVLENLPETPVDTLSWSDLSLVIATADRGTATVDLVANRVSWSGTIPPGTAATITIVAAIQGLLDCRQVSNQGSLTFSGQPSAPPITVFTNPAAFAACP